MFYKYINNTKTCESVNSSTIIFKYLKLKNTLVKYKFSTILLLLLKVQ